MTLSFLRVLFLSVLLILCVAAGPAPAAPASYAPTPLKGPSKVTIREDHTLLVNGQPFFPIGLYYAEEESADASGRSLKELAATGFNMLFLSPGKSVSDTKPIFDRFAAAGIRAQFRPPGDMLGVTDVLRQNVNAFKNHPAMLFWEHCDEPIVNQVNDIGPSRQAYKLVKQLDPNHPVLCVQWPDWKKGPKLKEWSEVCDVYGFDKYPVPLKRWWYQDKDIPPGCPYSIAVMGHDVNWMQSLAPTKPIIAVLQAWQIHGPEDGIEGVPTAEQSRFMAYQVVIAGAKGISYYGRIRASKPHPEAGLPEKVDPPTNFAKAKEINDKFWAYHKPIVKQLSEMCPVFGSKDADWKPEIKLAGETGAKVEEIQFRVKEGVGAPVILLVNSSEKPAKIRLSAAKFAGAKVYAWFDKTELQADDKGVFEDELAPFGVRVYSTQATPARAPSPAAFAQ